MAALQLERNAAGETGLGKDDEHVPWAEALLQPPPWYGSREAVRIADNLLAYQCPSGGWEKNIDMAEEHPGNSHGCMGTIDNGSTYTQLRFLARVYTSTGNERFADSFRRGLDYLFQAQNENGGWPQFFPLRGGYYSHITFNDDAMANVLMLLQDIVDRRAEFGFVESSRVARASQAIRKGIECILRCQIRTGDTLTAWCAQHEENSFLPAPARSFEPVSLSGRESVGIVEFLMRQRSPDTRIIQSVQAAVRWLNRAKIRGIRLERVPDPGAPKGVNTLLLPDPGAPALWARFYEIGTNRPLFVDRDGREREGLDQLSTERRNNYAWFGDWGESLLSTDYPRWQKQWAPGHNVLGDEGAVR
jgi:PelA/Pel-15E family pectate lyase